MGSTRRFAAFASAPLAVAVLVIAAGAHAVSGGSTITTVAGSGFGFAGDGGPATVAKMESPTALAFDAAGNLYIATGDGVTPANDDHPDRVRRVSPGGIITTVVDNLTYPHGLAVDGAGNLYISDRDGVRKRSPGGTLTVVVKKGVLNNPKGLALDAAGNLYVADAGAGQVRKVAPSGKITTVAGTGTAGYSGDGGPATAAMLKGVHGLAVDPAGVIYIADTGNHRVRKVGKDATITTVVGTGVKGLAGDGGPATAAKLNQPADVELDAAGNLYIADYGNHRVRKVPQVALGGQRISPVAGTGASGFSGDGGPGFAAKLNLPVGLAVDIGGSLYIADVFNYRVRKLTNRLPKAVIKTLIRARTSAAPLKVDFDASGSSDPDGKILSYGWAFGDGTRTRAGAGEKVSHTYTKAGNYTAQLTVMDDSGAKAGALALIKVTP